MVPTMMDTLTEETTEMMMETMGDGDDGSSDTVMTMTRW